MRILFFITKPYSVSVIQPLEYYCNNNNIENVRSRVAKYGMDNDHTWNNKPITSFFRKGEVGNYESEMPADLLNYFNLEAKTELEYFNYL